MSKEKDMINFSIHIKGDPDEVSRLKDIILASRPKVEMAFSVDDANAFYLKDYTQENTERTSLSGNVYALLNTSDLPHLVFIAKGEPYPCEYNTSLKMTKAHFAILTTNNLFNPIELLTNTDELAFNLEHCRPATREEVDLLRKLLFEKGFVWDRKKECLTSPSDLNLWQPKEGELCWICYPLPFKDGLFTPILIEDPEAYPKELRKGIVFKNKRDCQLMCNKLNDAIQRVVINKNYEL